MLLRAGGFAGAVPAAIISGLAFMSVTSKKT